MEPILNEHEVIRFLVSKGGRCTNFELVSNFRGALNDPQSKGERDTDLMRFLLQGVGWFVELGAICLYLVLDW